MKKTAERSPVNVNVIVIVIAVSAVARVASCCSWRVGRGRKAVIENRATKSPKYVFAYSSGIFIALSDERECLPLFLGVSPKVTPYATISARKVRIAVVGTSITCANFIGFPLYGSTRIGDD